MGSYEERYIVNLCDFCNSPTPDFEWCCKECEITHKKEIDLYKQNKIMYQAIRKEIKKQRRQK